MVGSIKNITGQRVEVSRGMSESKAQSEKLSGSVSSNISGSKVDAVLTSKSREALKVMAENPSTIFLLETFFAKILSPFAPLPSAIASIFTYISPILCSIIIF